MKYTPEQIERFWAKIAITANPDKCWVWQACKYVDGYGSFAINRVPRRAHRIMWELTYGEIPPGLYVLHDCPDGDNRACVNPSHLFLGTDADNKKDMVSKNRQASGERSNLHKLTSEKVRSIRERYAAGGILQRELAAEHGVEQTCISAIIIGKSWGKNTLRPENTAVNAAIRMAAQTAMAYTEDVTKTDEFPAVDLGEAS